VLQIKSKVDYCLQLGLERMLRMWTAASRCLRLIRCEENLLPKKNETALPSGLYFYFAHSGLFSGNITARFRINFYCLKFAA